MALPPSGQIDLLAIINEWGGPNDLLSYYRGGQYVLIFDLAPNVPSSGTISLQNFYGAMNVPPVTVTLSTYSLSKTVYFSNPIGVSVRLPDSPATVNATITGGYGAFTYQWLAPPGVTEQVGITGTTSAYFTAGITRDPQTGDVTTPFTTTRFLRATDSLGGFGDSLELSIYVDGIYVPLVTPTMNAVSAYYNTLPTFTGTKGNTNTVTVYASTGVELGSTSAIGTSWSITPASMTDGTYTVYCVGSSYGSSTANVSPTGNATFVLDRVAPSQPVIQTASGTYSTAGFNVTIAAESGSTVKLYQTGPALLATGTATSGTVTLNTGALTAGAVSLYATSTDAANNTSTGASVNYTILSPPGTPTFNSVAGSYNTLNNITFSGTGSASGNTITVVNTGTGTTYAQTTINANLTWSVSPNATFLALADGAYSVHCYESNAVGTSGNVTGGTITIDRVAPSAPTVSAAATIIGTTGTSVNVTAESGSTIKLYRGTGTLLNTATGTGAAVSVATGTLPTGSQTIYATATDAAGNVSANSNSVTLTVYDPISITTQSPLSLYGIGTTIAESDACTVTATGGSGSYTFTVNGPLNGGVSMTSVQTTVSSTTKTFAWRTGYSTPAILYSYYTVTVSDATSSAVPSATTNTITIALEFTGP